MTERIAVVAGVGEHGDPWHDLEAVAAAVAAVLAGAAGGVAEVRRTTTDDAAAWHDARLLVLAVSGDLDRPAAPAGGLVDAIERHHRAGRPILALHSAALAFRDDPRWRAILGGRWVPGVSMHPPIGDALVRAASGAAAGIAPPEGDFTVYDERYTSLEVAESVGVLAHHVEDGSIHPLMWARPADATSGAVVYDALGHGVESLASGAHAAWLAETARTLLAGTAQMR